MIDYRLKMMIMVRPNEYIFRMKRLDEVEITEEVKKAITSLQSDLADG